MEKLKYGFATACFYGLYLVSSKFYSSPKKYSLYLEIGGTGIKAFLQDSNVNLLDKSPPEEDLIKVETTSNPKETISSLIQALKDNYDYLLNSVKEVKIVCFGPLVINKKDPRFGEILNTPKQGWTGFNVVQAFSAYFTKAEIFINTDVNAAVLLEVAHGDHQVDSVAYITVGTGVGIGLYINNNIITGLQHTEGGHMTIKRDSRDEFEGCCKIHGDCLEGLVSNNAIARRAKLESVHDLPSLADETAWDIVADYLAQCCLNLVYTVSVEKIVIGGGIINRPSLLAEIQEKVKEKNKNYISHPRISENLVSQTNFSNLAGIVSAYFLK